jgi:hypothetical protein
VSQAVKGAQHVDAAHVFPMKAHWQFAVLSAAVLLVAVTYPRGGDDPGVLARRSMATAAAGTETTSNGQTAGSSRTPDQQIARSDAGRTPARAESSEQQTQDSPGAQPPGTDDKAASGRGNAAARQSETQGLARSSPGARAGGGSGSAGVGSRIDGGAGGVSSGELISSSIAATQTTAAGHSSPQTAAAQRNAEAAINRGDIPPELRSYVRAYFRAITR